MSELVTEHIRNIALAGHAGAGKTTLFEALLHAGGAIQSIGTVERGNTVSDTDAQEQSRAHSIDSSIAQVQHDDCRINLIDTAGYADFRGGTLSALAAVESVAIVVNAINGIEHGTRRMMMHAHERGLARMLVVNKIDLVPEEERDARVNALVRSLRWKGPVFRISGLAHQGLDGLCQAIMSRLEELNPPTEVETADASQADVGSDDEDESAES